MTSSTVKRSKFAAFLNTGTNLSPTWSLIGDGITSAKINYNPKTSEEIFIHQDTGTTEIESYNPVLPIEAQCKSGDPVFDAIDALRQSRAILSDAYKEILLVYLYETPVGSEYPAERQAVSVQVDDFGGDGGSSNKINFTLNFMGDPTLGTYNPSSGAFTPNPNLAALTSLAVGSLTLTPTFTRNHRNYTAPSAVDSVTVVPVAESEDAEVIIRVDDVVKEDGICALAEGMNTISVEVTVGTEVITYIVVVTYTAP